MEKNYSVRIEKNRIESFERTQKFSDALLTNNINDVYATFAWMVRRYFGKCCKIFAEDQFIIQGCCRVMSDYSAEGIWNCEDMIYSTKPRYALTMSMTNALYQWNMWYEEIMGIEKPLGVVEAIKDELSRELFIYNEIGKFLAYHVKLDARDCRVLYFNESRGTDDYGYHEVFLGSNNEMILQSLGYKVY